MDFKGNSSSKDALFSCLVRLPLFFLTKKGKDKKKVEMMFCTHSEKWKEIHSHGGAGECISVQSREGTSVQGHPFLFIFLPNKVLPFWMEMDFPSKNGLPTCPKGNKVVDINGCSISHFLLVCVHLKAHSTFRYLERINYFFL